MPWYNNRFKNKPLSTRYLQSIAVLKNDFTNPSLMYIRDYQFALSGFNRFLCKNVANPPSGDAMKDAFYASALQNFSPANADFLLYDLMRISAMTSKQWFLNNAERFNKDCHNPVFKALINDIGQDVALAVKTGSNSMDLQNTAGKVINLKDILEQTKDSVVYVDFWAGWCAPCIAEMPHSIKLQQQYKNRKIAFIYFSLDNTRSEWLKSMKSQPQMHASNSYFVVNGDNSALSKWVNLNSIPRYIVFDKNKKLVKNDAPRPSDKEVQPMLNLLLEN
jgi:thiol-disulfide isomerase/thioredoxin